jgi:hypothetical protein
MYARTARHWPPSRETGPEPTRRAASPTNRKTSKANRGVVPRASVISRGQPSPTWHFLGRVIEHRRRVGVLRPDPFHGRTGRFVGDAQDNGTVQTTTVGRARIRSLPQRRAARERRQQPPPLATHGLLPPVRRPTASPVSGARAAAAFRRLEPNAVPPLTRLLPCRGTGRFPLAHLTTSRSGPPLCGGAVVEPIGPALPPALRFDHPRIT